VSNLIRGLHDHHVPADIPLKIARRTVIHKHKAIVDGVEYGTGDLIKRCGIVRDCARRRIINFNEGKLTAEELLTKGKLTGGKKRSCAVIDGVEYWPEDVARICDIKYGSARNKIIDFNAGKMTKEKLFSTARDKSKRKRSKANPNADYRALGDKQRRGARFQIGTWEKENIKPLKRKRRKGRIAEQPPGPVYYPGQFMINL